MLAGFPIKEYQVHELDGDQVSETKWVPEVTLQTYFQQPCGTYEITGKTRMAYAPPAWLNLDGNENGHILFLDDFSRANSMFMQAIMELIDKASYMTWSLPENTTIVLSSNPDDGDYQVHTLDTAQATRMVTFQADFNIEDWAAWAEEAEVDSRAINFALSYATELFESKDTRVKGLNARSYTTFCNLVGGLPDWSNPEQQSLIVSMSKGCFSDPSGVIGGLFLSFVQNRLDRLPSPEELLVTKWDTLYPKLENLIYPNGVSNTANACIAAILSTRLANYSVKYLKTKGTKEATVLDRLVQYITPKTGQTRLFSEDLIFKIVQTLVGKCPARTKSFILNPEIRKRLL